MIHEIIEIFHHYLLKHVQVRNQDMWCWSDIVTVGKSIATCINQFYYKLYCNIP